LRRRGEDDAGKRMGFGDVSLVVDNDRGKDVAQR
jgi:hypothetical protein